MAQVTVKKSNKVLNIEDTRLESYLLQGFDQIDSAGNVVTKATGGRTVSLQEYNKVLDAFQNLANGNDELTLEFEDLKKENAALKSKVTKLEKAAKE